jgi:N-acylneuraminate cytidylyltransferase
MANCPLVRDVDLLDSFDQFKASNSDAQISVMRYGWGNPWWAMERDEGYHLTPLFPEALTQRSQDLPELFCPTGAVWWARSDVLRRAGTFYVPNRTGWEIPWERGADIDTEDDWRFVEVLQTVLDTRAPPQHADRAG